MNEVVVPEDAVVVVRVVQPGEVKLHELEQAVQAGQIAEQPRSVAEDAFHAVEHLLDGTDAATATTSGAS